MSSEITGAGYDLRAVTDSAAAGHASVPHERELLALAEAVVRGDDAALAAAGSAAIAVLGADGFVEAAAVASNFERMVRIADGTGIPLGEGLETRSRAVVDELRLERLRAGGDAS